MVKNLFTLIFAGIGISAAAQTQIANGGFETWGNGAPGNADEPTGWFSNKTGSTVAAIGPQTAFKETTNVHSGSSCIRIETKTVPVIGTAVNGNLTTGVVNAPDQNKNKGYIGTINYSTASDQRRMVFTGKPDSLVGYYKYEQATSGTGAALEKGKVRAILHSGDYFDPETPVSNNHPDVASNKIGDALFFTETSNTTTWKRFSVPFSYVSTNAPAFIMINITSSANQLTSAVGSKLWLDDLQVIYNQTTGIDENSEKSFNVYSFERNIFVDLKQNNILQSTITLFDVAGKKVLSQKIEGNLLNEISVPANLKTGTYFYELSGSEMQQTGKLIIR